MASNQSACSNGGVLYVFCPHYDQENFPQFPVPCCPNSTPNETNCGDLCPYDGPTISNTTHINTTQIIDWSSCHKDPPFWVCETPTPVPKDDDCCKKKGTPCQQRCSQGGPALGDVSFAFDAGTESLPATPLPSSPSVSPYMTYSSWLSTTTTITSTTEPLRAQNPTPLINSGPGTTHTGQPDLQNNRAAPKSNTAAVAGGITGGIVGLALLFAVLAICCRQRITGPSKSTDQRKLPTWRFGQARAIGAGGGELEEIKQRPSPTTSLLQPPSSWPLPPPPGYTPYRPHQNELDRLPPNVSQPSASFPPTFDTHPPPESPPSPPPLNTRASQDSADENSESQSVSPISSHYQRHPLDESEDLKASVYSGISSNDLFHTHNKRS